MQSTFVSDFKINKMTKAQYSGIVPSQTEVYITTDEADAVASVNNITPNANGNVTIKTSNITNDSGYITSSALSGYATETWVGNQGYITGINSGDVTTALGYTPVNPSSLATVATSGDYDDLLNKPTITTPNDGVLTITQDSNTVGTFTANQSTNETLNIKGLYDYYGLNCKEAGALINNDGIISDFSASNYAYMREPITPPACWEFGFTFTTGTNGGTQYIIGNADTTDNLIKFWIVGNSITWSIGGVNSSSGDTLNSNTEYKVRIIRYLNPDYSYRGNYMYLYVYNASGTLLYDRTLSLTSTSKSLQCAFGVTNSSGSFINPFDGSIDLKNVYFDSLLYDAGTDSATATRLWTGAIPLIDTKVSKLGDTMTGDLSIIKTNSNPVINTQRNDIYLGDTPASATRVQQFQGLDGNGKTVSLIQSYISSSGNSLIEFALQKHDSSGWNSVQFSTTPNGDAYFIFPKCTTAATTSSTASSNKVAVVTQNYKNGNSWYRVWSDGWIEQGSLVQTTSSSYTVSFVKTFATRNYTFQVTPSSGSKTDTGGIGTVTVPVLPDTDTKTVSGIKLTSVNSRWIFWYACGY